MVALVCGLALGGCADDPGQPPGTDDTAAVTEPTPSDEPTEPAESANDDLDPADLPGEPTDIGPADADELAVIGVAGDDVLHLRRGPGVKFDVVAELAPMADNVAATGEARQLDRSIWFELTADGVTGWANMAYLGYLGQVTDVTAQIADLPSGTDLEALAQQVVEQRNPHAEADLTVVVVDGPHTGDLAEITVDVLGLMDDSVIGERLHIFAHPDGSRFSVRTVEATTLCSRGVTDDRLCI